MDFLGGADTREDEFGTVSAALHLAGRLGLYLRIVIELFRDFEDLHDLTCMLRISRQSTCLKPLDIYVIHRSECNPASRKNLASVHDPKANVI